MRADVVVLGLGALGSACTCHLAKRGLRVVGLDRFTPPHGLGSSGGGTRIFRQAYFEGAEYVPMSVRALELWRDLEVEANRRLLVPTGMLGIGSPNTELVRRSLDAARLHGIPADLLSATDVAARWPVLGAAGVEAVWEPGAGVLLADACIRAHLEAAERAGARLLFDAPVVDWSPAHPGVPTRVRAGGITLEAPFLVVAAGAWLGALVPGVLELTVERQVQLWLRPFVDVSGLPAVIWEYTAGRHFYVVPDVDGNGLKAAIHHEGQLTSVDVLDRTVSPYDVARLRGLLAEWAPFLDGPPVDAKVCMYTNTPDGHFLVGRVPGMERTLVAGGGSGHAFKFAPAIGEAIADLVWGSTPRIDLSLFRPDRFSPIRD